jgi:hypothetical protein
MSLKYLGGYTGNRPAWSTEQQPGVWTLYDRFGRAQTVTKTVAVAPDATVVDELSLTSPCLIQSVRLSRRSWIRFYSSSASRLRDAARLVTEDPSAGAGVHLEIRTAGDTTVRTAPIPYMVGREPGNETLFPFRLTNESTDADVLVEVVFLPLVSYL